MKWDVDTRATAETGARRIVVFTEHINATYHLSFHCPLGSTRWQLLVASQNCIANYSPEAVVKSVEKFEPEAVFFSRWGAVEGVTLMRILQSTGLPCIYHIDDDLLNLPDSLGPGVLAAHGSADVLRTRSTMLAEAGLIYASTESLRRILQARFSGQRIFSGMYAPVLQSNKYKFNGKLTIGYMGSKGHSQDLALIEPALERVMTERPLVSFATFGTIKPPERLLRFGNRVSHKKVMKHYPVFIGELATLNWDIGLAPLENITFNCCKAPTKFIEYTSAGIPVIASEINVYQEHVGENRGWLSSDDAWYATICQVLERETDRLQRQQQAAEYVESKFSISQLEIQLVNVLAMVNI